MKTAEGGTVITNGRLVDGTGAAPVADAGVVVRDGRVADARRAAGNGAAPGPAAAWVVGAGRVPYPGPAPGAAEVPPDAGRVDARRGTILPGLVEAHFHPKYFNVAELADLAVKYPVEYVT